MEPDVVFRRLRDHALPRGHAIFCAAFHWLMSRNIRQWTAPVPMPLSQAWHRQQGNYRLFVEGNVAVVLTRVDGPCDPWRDGADGATVLWLHALATAPPCKGRGCGRHAVRCAMDIAQARPSDLTLLCAQGNGFLPAFYQSLGLHEVTRAPTPYAGLGMLEMVLMR